VTIGRIVNGVPSMLLDQIAVYRVKQSTAIKSG
jgi:hypothetical protein